MQEETHKPYVVKSGFFSKLGSGWWPTWLERYFVLYSNGEFNYYISDVVEDDTEPQGTIHLSSIVGLHVVESIPGPERPGLVLKTERLHSKRDYFLAAREGASLEEVAKWVPAIMALREGKVPDVREEEVLLEFSMNSSDEEQPEEVDCLLSSEERPRPLAASADLVVEQLPEPPRGPDVEDVRAIEALSRSWDSLLRRDMLEKTLVRCVNYFVGMSGERIRNLVDLSDGVVLVQLMRALGQPVEHDETGGSRYENAFKVATVAAAVSALREVSKAVDASAGLIVNGNVRAIAWFVWAALYLLVVKKTEFEGTQGIPGVVRFVQTSTQGYQHVRVTDLSNSFLDGFALSAILDHWYPEALDFDTLQPHLAQRNLERVFCKANELLAVPILLDAADFADSHSFDETSLVLYLTIFLRCLRQKKLEEEGVESN